MAKAVKKWFSILAPKIFNQIEVSEARGFEDQMLGRTVYVLVSDLTGDMRKSHLKLKLRITDVNGDKLTTRIEELQLLRSYLRSIVRRRVRRIDETIKVSTRDGASITIKPIVITAGLCTKEQERAIRKKIIEVVTETAKERTLDAFILDLISEKLPKDIRKAVTPIYPLRNVEIRKADNIQAAA